MTELKLFVAIRRLATETLRSARRVTRQMERRLRYRRLGWV